MRQRQRNRIPRIIVLIGIAISLSGVSRCSSIDTMEFKSGMKNVHIHYAAKPAYLNSLSASERKLRQSLYNSIILSTLSSNTYKLYVQTKLYTGVLAPYRKLQSPKAIAACVDWRTATRTYVKVQLYVAVTKHFFPNSFSVIQCGAWLEMQSLEKRTCQCHLIDSDDRNTIMVPKPILQRLAR